MIGQTFNYWTVISASELGYRGNSLPAFAPEWRDLMPVKRPRAKPIYAYAFKTRHGLDLLSISESRSDLILQANKPAGQSVVIVRISEVRKRPDRGDEKP